MWGCVVLWYMGAVGWACDGSRGRDGHYCVVCGCDCIPGFACVYCVAGVCWEEVWVGGRQEGGCDVQAGVWEGRGKLWLVGRG